ncbi:hypothetical protein EW146_g2031 [Bondarzewia mesenterica]|uniref:Glycogenin glucosyltransferase n=1 Tax=Bondarzewia mesenterica TaxID=1095465 RepID=A0A4S4M1Y7_9AGAM|nr:hypothetical protein EW146_g2031 [Bondarzewia mesenterica]
MATPYAFVTLLTSDSYLPGALTLVAALRDLHASPPIPPEVDFQTVCLVTPETVDVSSIKLLRRAFNVVVGVEIIEENNARGLQLLGKDISPSPSPNSTAKASSPLFHACYDACLEFIAYVLTPDYLPQDVPICTPSSPSCTYSALLSIRRLYFLMPTSSRPVHSLIFFSFPHEFAAVPDVGWPDIFNTGLMVLTPGEAKFNDLMDLSKSKGSWDGGDQGLLNEWRGSDWYRLSFTYNTTPTAAYTYAPAYERFGSQISAIHFIGSNKPWDSIPWRAPGSSDAQQAASGPLQAYDYSALVDRWYAVYDKHYRSTATVPATDHALQRYEPAWEKQGGLGAEVSRTLTTGSVLGLEDLRKIAIEGFAGPVGHAQTLPGEGRYMRLPLEGRFDLMRPLPEPKIESEAVSEAAAGDGDKTPQATQSYFKTGPSTPGLGELHTLPTPGPDELPPVPHPYPRSLPPSSPETPSPPQAPGMHIPAQIQPASPWHPYQPDHAPTDATKSSPEIPLAKGHAQHIIHRPPTEPVQHYVQGVHFHYPTGISGSPLPSPSHQLTPRDSETRTESETQAPTGQAQDEDVTLREDSSQGHHLGEQPPPIRQHLESPLYLQSQWRHEEHHEPPPPPQEPPRPSSPPMVAWNPAIEPPPKEAPVSNFPTDTYFPNAWDRSMDPFGTPAYDLLHSPTPPSSALFALPPPGQIPQRLLREGHYINVLGEQSDVAPSPDRTKVKSVFPWEERPRHTPARVFPSTDAPPPGTFIASSPSPLTSPQQLLSPLQQTPSPRMGLPTNFAFSNAWDSVPSIQRYASKLVRPARAPVALAPAFDLAESRKQENNLFKTQWDESGESSVEGDDEDTEDEDERQEDRKRRSRSGSASQPHALKGKKKEYRMVGVQTIPKETRDQGVQVAILPDPSVADRLAKGKKGRIDAGTRVRGTTSPPDNREWAAVPGFDGPVPGPAAVGGFSQAHLVGPGLGVTNKLSPLESPTGLRSPRMYSSPKSSPKTSSSNVAGAFKQAPPLRTHFDRMSPVARTLSSDAASSSPSSAGPPTSPMDTLNTPVRKTAARVWDPARGVDIFKKGSEEVLARFLKMGSWGEEEGGERERTST